MGNIASGIASGPTRRLATPGAVLLLAGLALLWWGLGIFRGEVGSSTTKRGPIDIPKPTVGDDDHGHDHAAGGGGRATKR